MSHVDDGRLHAYLDGALPELQERRQIEDHLRRCAECRAQLEAARADRESARQILGALEPTARDVPPFEQLLAHRGDPARRGGGPLPQLSRSDGSGPDLTGSPPSAPRTPRWLVPAVWAATVFIAIGSGWMARGVLGPGPPPDPNLQPAVAERARVDAQIQALGDDIAPRVEEARRIQAPALARERGRDEAEVAAAPAALTPERAGVWTATSAAAAGSLLGRAPLEIGGVPPVRMEQAAINGRLVIRTTYLVDGTDIELIQQPSVSAGGTLAVLLTDASVAGPGRTAVFTEREGITVLIRGFATAEALTQLVSRLE